MDTTHARMSRAEYMRAWRKKNPESAAASVRKWRATHPGANAASKRRWRAKNPGADAEYARKWRARNAERAKASSRLRATEHRKNNLAEHIKASNDYKARCREAIFHFFGEKCVRCGFSDKRALQMDHINGLGKQEERMRLSQRYRLIANDPEKAISLFQILCANCNVIKAIENREVKGYRSRRI